MGRWSQYDEDDHRLPEGMRRVGYDSDTQVYTYQDADGSYWEGAEGARYGTLKPVGRSTQQAPQSGQSGHTTHSSNHPVSTTPFDFSNYDEQRPKDPSDEKGESPWRLLAPFLLLVCLVLLLLFRLLNGGAASDTHPAKKFTCGDQQRIYEIREADTCWAIAQEHNMSVKQLKSINAGIDCDVLKVGQKICVDIKS